ncbi:Fic family protein [Hamadaea tsunoensis]|uniref:Fic family protein n=1 Tax=Hamadaea tsunoensis TaxID=53368 RepID=UPI001B7F99C8|nr:Fic family protein [Hamadaea tsunoensis]
MDVSMRQPMSPPPLESLLSSAFRDGDTTSALARLWAQAVGQPYRHWDEMRFRQPPAGFTLEQWWVATKLRRASTMRPLSITDRGQRRFHYCLPDEVLRETEFIASRLSGRIGQAEQVMNPATRDQYLVTSLIEEAVTSSQLEGASTDRRVAKDMIRSGRAPRDRSERMILNNFAAMEKVSDRRAERLTPEMICELHRVVTDGTLDDPRAAGRFQQSGEERVVIRDDQGAVLYDPPPAEEIADRVQELCDFANETTSIAYLPPVLRALTIHFMIGYIHPFEDGNGRTARILFYWSMLNQGYWLTEFLSVSRLLKKAPGKYGRSFLHTESDDGDMTYFYIYHLGILHRAIDALDGYLATKVDEAREVRSLLSTAATDFNSRQIALLQNSIKHDHVAYSVQSHMMSHRIAMETARKDLVELEQAGLLAKTRSGKKFVYAAVPDLVQILKHDKRMRGIG